MHFEHHGHTVTVNTDFRFVVTGPQFSEKDDPFSSANDAKSEITKRIEAAQKEAVASRRISLPAFDAGTAREITIRGVNRTDSSVLGALDKGWFGANFFPAVSWIKPLLAERLALLARVAEIEKQLLPYGMRAKVGYGGRVDPKDYETKTATLETEFDRKAQAALAATPKSDAA